MSFCAGVSNFGLEELAGLVKFAKTKPSVIQSQSDPLRPNVAVQVFCERAGIQFQASSATLVCFPMHIDGRC